MAQGWSQPHVCFDDGAIFLAPQCDEREERLVERLCPFGTCVTLTDPADNTVFGGWGSVGCGCDSLPGWRSKYYDGLPKPGVALKPVGRHGSRIARSRRKHAEHKRWVASL